MRGWKESKCTSLCFSIRLWNRGYEYLVHNYSKTVANIFHVRKAIAFLQTLSTFLSPLNTEMFEAWTWGAFLYFRKPYGRFAYSFNCIISYMAWKSCGIPWLILPHFVIYPLPLITILFCDGKVGMIGWFATLLGGWHNNFPNQHCFRDEQVYQGNCHG